MALMRLLLDSEYLKPISAVTSGVFRTQYHDKMDMDNFETLKYDHKYCRPNIRQGMDGDRTRVRKTTSCTRKIQTR